MHIKEQMNFFILFIEKNSTQVKLLQHFSISAKTTCDWEVLMSLDEEQFEEENEMVSSNRGWSSGSSIEDCPLGPLV